jgi:hypothetical protein
MKISLLGLTNRIITNLTIKFIVLSFLLVRSRVKTTAF